jgi:hypothetical protein
MHLTKEEYSALNQHAEIMLDLYHHINEVRKQPLHPGQVQVAKEFFVNKRRITQCQWGRNCGKTELILYTAWVFALLNPGSEIYVICPEKLQGKKIYWSSKRLQKYGPKKYIEKELDSECRLVFNNGSSILVDGCENYESLRGVKPHLVIYDEFQHHNREFHVEVMEPNLLGRDCALLVCGTPPKRDCYYVEFRKNLLEEIKNGDSSRFYLEIPTWLNPSIKKDELEKIKQKLYKNGDEKVWLREYEAQLILGGEGAVFPTWNRDKKHTKQHAVLMAALEKDSHKLNWYTICDPGSSSCFAVLFAVHNPYTAQIFIVGEIYQKDRKLTDAVSMWKQISEMEKELNPDGKWRRVYDEAAKWFANEIQRHFRVALSPTHKHRRNKTEETDDISLIKSMMSHEDCLYVSHRCQWLMWEVENYVTDEHDEYPDKDDHLIDCFLYLVAACRFKFTEKGDNVLFRNRDEFLFTNNRFIAENIPQSDQWSDMVLESSLMHSVETYDA